MSLRWSDDLNPLVPNKSSMHIHTQSKESRSYTNYETGQTHSSTGEHPAKGCRFVGAIGRQSGRLYVLPGRAIWVQHQHQRNSAEAGRVLLLRNHFTVGGLQIPRVFQLASFLKIPNHTFLNLHCVLFFVCAHFLLVSDPELTTVFSPKHFL